MQAFIDYLARLPVEWFVLIGSFIEELISPIPSFMVFLPTGASAQAQGRPLEYLLVLGVIAGIGHVAGSAVLYVLANKFRDYLFGKRHTWFGVSLADVEHFRQKLRGRWSWLTVFAAWALPIFPGAPLSLTCGFVRIPFWTFVTATFAGSIINALIYMYIGYYGLRALATLNVFEIIGQVLLVAVVVISGVWLYRHYYKRRKRTQLHQKQG
jgi:membrane protein DedA with SNARE-associated domain